MKPIKFKEGMLNLMKPKISNLLLLLFATLVTACTPKTTPASSRTLTVMTHDSFAISESVIAKFEAEYDVKVNSSVAAMQVQRLTRQSSPKTIHLQMYFMALIILSYLAR